MSRSLEQVCRALQADVEVWITAPGDGERALKAIQTQLEESSGAIGKTAVRQALRALKGSENEVRRVKLRRVADAVSAALAPLGVVLEAKPPKKRRRRGRPSATLGGKVIQPGGGGVAEGGAR